MDTQSEDQLPPLEQAHTDDQMPAPSIVAMYPLDLFHRTVEEAESEDGDMPALMSVSDSSDDEEYRSSLGPPGDPDQDNSEWEDEDDGGLDEVFGGDDSGDMPALEPFPGAPSRSTTHAEGEDDMPPLIPINPSSNSRPPPPSLDPSWLPPRPGTRPTIGFPDLISLRTVFEALHMGPFPDGQIPRGMLDQLVMHATHIELAGQGQSPQSQTEPDLERAKLLVGGLETVPEGLLTRMARVGGAPGGHEDLSGEDENSAGCAVCWASLLEDKTEDPKTNEEQPLPFASEGSDETRIVCLPCAHVFHASCLLPWFSRTTTCPTCRFDVDPGSLTRRRHPQPGASGTTTNANQTPIDDWEDQTDVDEDELNPFDLEDDLEASLLDTIVDDDLIFNSLYGTAHHGTNGERSRSRRRKWTLPVAPGKSLRERIVEKEREIGLRCLDATCVLGPTDEDPNAAETTKQILIRVAEECQCKHTLHPACLVVSVRVAALGQSPVQDSEDSDDVEVSCPSCRVVGTVSREDWEEGVAALALVD